MDKNYLNKEEKMILQINSNNDEYKKDNQKNKTDHQKENNKEFIKDHNILFHPHVMIMEPGKIKENKNVFYNEKEIDPNQSNSSRYYKNVEENNQNDNITIILFDNHNDNKQKNKLSLLPILDYEKEVNTNHAFGPFDIGQINIQAFDEYENMHTAITMKSLHRIEKEIFAKDIINMYRELDGLCCVLNEAFNKLTTINIARK